MEGEGGVGEVGGARGGGGGALLRKKAVALLGNLETWRLVVMQHDYYWLGVTSCCPPHEAHHCGLCEGCVELSPGNLPQKRNKARTLNTSDRHTEERDFYVNEELNKFTAKIKKCWNLNSILKKKYFPFFHWNHVSYMKLLSCLFLFHFYIVTRWIG